MGGRLTVGLGAVLEPFRSCFLILVVGYQSFNANKNSYLIGYQYIKAGLFDFGFRAGKQVNR